MAGIAILVAGLLAACQSVRPSDGPTQTIAVVQPSATPEEPAVATNPFPTLLPDGRFSRGTQGANTALAIIEAYGAVHPESYAGAWIDQGTGVHETVYSRWTADWDTHIAALRPNLPIGVRARFLEADHTLSELYRLLARIGSDAAWLDSIPAHVLRAGIDPDRNQAVVDVSSPAPDASQTIRGHLGVTEAELDVRSDGTGAWFAPWGTIRIALSTKSGLPVDPHAYGPNLQVSWSPAAVDGRRCDPAKVADVFVDGLPCQAGQWSIQLNLGYDGPAGREWTEVAAGTIDVVADQTGVLHLEAMLRPPPTNAPG